LFEGKLGGEIGRKRKNKIDGKKERKNRNEEI
jgi:hypothetical protein